MMSKIPAAVVWFLLCVSGAFGQNSEDLAQAAQALGSTDFLTATDATNELFDAGADSIPFLMRNFSDSSRYLGLCGFKICSSDAMSEAEAMEETRVRRRRPEPRGTEVREMSLYLVIAVMKENLYFGMDCTLVLRDQSEQDGLSEEEIILNEEKVSEILDDIAESYFECERDSREFVLDEIESILKNHSAGFPPII